MRTAGMIQAVLGNQEIGKNAPFDKCLLDDPWDTLHLNMTVPDPLGIDHYHRPVFALVEAPGEIGPPASSRQPLLFQFILERLSQNLRLLRIAAPSRMSRLAPVAADKNM